jgi:uncharacterized RDD family membrane protein YckC
VGAPRFKPTVPAPAPAPPAELRPLLPEPASPGQRFWARTLDWLAFVATLGVSFLVLGRIPEVGIFLAVACTLMFLAVQVVFLSMRGQSVGKMILGLEIVLDDGSPAGFFHAVLLREVVPLLILMIPVAGFVFEIVDRFYVFSDDRRRLHDRIAGTRVIRLSRG